MTDTYLPEFGFNQLAMTRHGPMLVNRYDTNVGASVIRLGEYSRDEADLLTQVLHPGQVAVEVGANMGTLSVPMAQRLGPDGRLYAFEPQRLMFQTLCANIALNSLANVLALPYAVGESQRDVLVPETAPEQFTNFGAIALGGTGARTRQVTIDEYDLPACHLLKIDVEGAEAAVIRGAVQTILRHRPMLYVENDRRHLSPALIQLIGSFGYGLFWHLPRLESGDDFNQTAEPVFPGYVSVNMFCVPINPGAKVQGLAPVTSLHDWPVPV